MHFSSSLSNALRTNQPTDWPTDKACNRDASPHLKIESNGKELLIKVRREGVMERNYLGNRRFYSSFCYLKLRVCCNCIILVATKRIYTSKGGSRRREKIIKSCWWWLGPSLPLPRLPLTPPPPVAWAVVLRYNPYLAHRVLSKLEFPIGNIYCIIPKKRTPPSHFSYQLLLLFVVIRKQIDTKICQNSRSSLMHFKKNWKFFFSLNHERLK